MRWDKLSMKEKGELMKLYMSGGVLSISEMKKHYNSYADGGDAYIAKKAEEARLAALERSRTMTKPIVPMVPNPLSQEDFEKNQDDIQKFVKKKLQSLEDEGKIRTIPSLSSQLKDKTYYANKGVENYVREVNNPNGIYAVGKYQSLVPGQSCMSTASGTYCKSITGNQSFAADPAKYGFKRVPNSEVLPGDLVQALTPENNIPSHAMIYDSMGEDNKPRYNYSSGGKDEASIVKRGKYPASNDKLYTYRFVGDHADSVKWRKEYNKKAFGGPLRDEYDNPEQYYDYKTAEEVGNMYDPGTQHWASRDPRTGMILKNPKHPTFGMAIREDQSSGYAPFIDSSTGRYYTLRPEEYATAPNKHTLRKVSNSEMEALYKEHNIDSWSRRKDFGKVIPGYTREEIDRRRSPYRDTLWEAAKNNNLNPEILDALATVESRYDNDATSDAGAKGIMQLMPVNTEKIDPRDGHQNIRRGAEVLSAFLKKNKGDMKKAIAAYNGYTKNPGAKVAKEEKGYTDNYYKVLYPLIDSLEKNSTTGFPFDRGGELKRDSTRPTVRPYFAGNFQEQEPQYTGPVIGEIRADERSKTQKFFDKVKTDYNTSSFGNSAIAEVLSATTPYGLIHEGMRGNTDTALLSVVPFGAEIKGVKNAVKAGRVGLKTLIDSSDRPNIPELVIKGDSGISAYTADKYRGSLDDFAKYLKRPEVREKIPSVYKDRLNYFLRNLENEPIPSAQAVLVNKIPKRVSNFAIEHGLGPSTKVDYSNKLSKNVAGQYDPKTDLVTMGESIKEGIFYPELLPHEYNHWLDYDSSFGDMLRVQIPEKEEYLKSLINPYKRNKLSYYIHNPKRLWKKIADRMPYDYLTTPTEVRAYSSEVLQRKALEKELLQKQGLQDFVAPLSESFFKNSSPMGKELMRAIKPSKRAAFLKNLEERGFSEGGILKID